MLKPCRRRKLHDVPALAVKRTVVEACQASLCGITSGSTRRALPAQRTSNRLTAAVMPVLIGPLRLE
jgi:hypothetical protein